MVTVMSLCLMRAYGIGAEDTQKVEGRMQKAGGEAANMEEGFIDTHVHAMACEEKALAAAAKWMEQHNVERCIIHPLKQSLPADDAARKRMLENYKAYEGKIYRFCIFEPDDVGSVEEAVKRLEQEKKDGAIGFGEHYGRGLNFDDPKNLRIYEACQKVGLPVMFHMDGGNNKDEKGLARLEKVLKAYPDCVLIAHAPGWWGKMADGTCDRLLQAYPNLYADVSAGSGARALSRDKKYTREFVIRNSGKLLFGTDNGWWTFGKEEKPAPQFSLFEELDLPADVKAKLYRKNAEKLFGFK